MAARESLAVTPHPGAKVTETAIDAPAGSGRSHANCAFCGQPWFGDVAYCPYCGRPSAAAPVGAAASAPPATPAPAPRPQRGSAALAPAAARRALARADPPGSHSKPAWKLLVTAATALLFVGIVMELAPTAGDKAQPQATAGAPLPGTAGDSPSPGSDRVAAPGATPALALVPRGRGVSENIAHAPGTLPVPPRAGLARGGRPRASAPPAAHRSLCSAASEAAGLCNPR